MAIYSVICKKLRKSYIIDILDLCKIARSQGKSARAESGLTEGEVALATSREGRPLSAEVSWSGDGGALRMSSIGFSTLLSYQTTYLSLLSCDDMLGFGMSNDNAIILPINTPIIIKLTILDV